MHIAYIYHIQLSMKNVYILQNINNNKKKHFTSKPAILSSHIFSNRFVVVVVVVAFITILSWCKCIQNQFIRFCRISVAEYVVARGMTILRLCMHRQMWGSEQKKTNKYIQCFIFLLLLLLELLCTRMTSNTNT